MPNRPVVLYPHPALGQKAPPIESVDEDLRALVADMIETMHAEGGVGLAANQVADPRRVFVLDLSGGEDPGAVQVMINPTIVEESGREVGEEGCLSFPGIYEMVARPSRVRFTYRDLDFVEREQTAEGYFARAVRHETDHLDGIVFTERMSPLKRRLVLRRIEKMKKTGEWPADAAP